MSLSPSLQLTALSPIALVMPHNPLFCGDREDGVDCEDDFEREEMGRDGIVDVGRDASLKIYIWEVESMEDKVIVG